MSVDSERLSSIAVFGRPHELWPVTALLGKILPDYVTLTLVEDDSEKLPPTGLSFARSDRLLEALEIDIRDLLLACNGSFGLGTDLQGLPEEGGGHFVAPSGKLPLVEGLPLHHIMLRAAFMHSEPGQLGYLMQPFRFAARVAAAGKFALPDSEPLGPAAMLGATIQIDRGDYADFLKAHYLPKQASLLSGPPGCVQLSDNESAVRSVRLESGEEIAADLFVDLSGDLSELVPDAPQKQSGILPFDRSISCYDEAASQSAHHHCCARAIDGGLLVETPFRNGTVSELLFSSADIDETALTALVGEDASAVSFDSYQFDAPWSGNLLRMGRASASLGPYQSADMRLLHEQALLFAAHIPVAADMKIEAAEYNHHQMRVLEEIRDFALLPFLANRREEGVWKDLADAPPPESLQLRIDQFESRGRFVEYDHEIFDTQSWTELLIGLDIVPRRYDPLARSADMQRIQPALKNMAGEFNRTIASMQGHTEFLNQFLAGKS